MEGFTAASNLSGMLPLRYRGGGGIDKHEIYAPATTSFASQTDNIVTST